MEIYRTITIPHELRIVGVAEAKEHSVEWAWATSARWPGQAERIAQGRAVVLSAEQPSMLQLRHKAGDQLLQAAWQIWDLQHEAVASTRLEPLLHAISHRAGRAGEAAGGSPRAVALS